MASTGDEELSGLAAAALNLADVVPASAGAEGEAAASRNPSALSAEALEALEAADARRMESSRFLTFTRLLVSHLEEKDPDLHERVRAVVRDCAEKNREGVAGYESVTGSMEARLREVVPDEYWTKAEAYLQHFLAARRGGFSPGGGGGPAVNFFPL